MLRYNFLTFTVILGYISVATPMSPKCQGIDVVMTEKHITDVKDCLKVVGAASITDLGMDNGGCFFKCTLEKKGLIDAEGKVHKDKVNEMVDSALPDSVKPGIKSGLEKCLDSDGTELMMAGDDSCSSFMPLAICFHGTFLEVCVI